MKKVFFLFGFILISLLAIGQKPDSSYHYRWIFGADEWKNNDRAYSTYNSQDSLTERLVQDWHDENWINFKYYQYKYLENGKLDSSIRSIWASDDDRWRGEIRHSYEYNALGQTKTQKTEETRWDGEKYNWQNILRTEQEYYPNGYLRRKIFLDWDPIKEQWVEGAKHESTYNSLNLVTDFIEFILDTNSNNYEALSHEHYQYYPDGQLHTYYRERRNEPGDEWEIGSLQWYEYNENDLLIKSGHDFFDDSTNDWVPGQHRTYYYQNGHLRRVEIFNWDQVQMDWQLVSRTHYLHDFWGNLIEFYTQSWLTDLGRWANGIQYTYHYDEHQRMTEEIHHWWHDTLFAWVPETWDVFYYSEPKATEPDLFIPAFSHPNPASHHTFIYLDEPTEIHSDVWVYDHSGRLIKNLINVAGNQIKLDLQNQSPGYYLFQVFAYNGHHYQGRFLLLH